MSSFKLTPKQQEAQKILAGNATHLMLFGGSRSGKTVLLTRNVVFRALKAPDSRHLIARFRLNHIKSAIAQDTFPKVMKLAFPSVEYEINKSDLFVTLPNGSEIWLAGLDDKDRTEKILGNEYATIYLNECSQIPFGAREMAVTRLAQKVYTEIEGRDPTLLKPRMYYDCNPPTKAHWTYKLFVEKKDPETRQLLRSPEDYNCIQVNPQDNVENLSDGYIDALSDLSARQRKRFLLGEFGDANPNALFNDEDFIKWRSYGKDLPEFLRVVVGVDPSGSGDKDNTENDAIGIVVGALGLNGKAYLLQDCTVKASPAVWGKVATDAYDRHKGDIVVGEGNYGGAMVEHVIHTSSRSVPYKQVTATRGKAVRAEPFSALYEQGKVVHVGDYPELEDELLSFSTNGYLGESSPNRADAWIWVLSELFPGLTRDSAKLEPLKYPDMGYV